MRKKPCLPGRPYEQIRLTLPKSVFLLLCGAAALCLLGKWVF
jgi:hypothetical protein